MTSFKALSFLVLLFLAFPSFAQIFSRVTTGDIVNDAGSSFGHSWCDFNQDGWEDLFVNNLAAGQSNFFYKNKGDGTFTRLSNITIEQGDAATSSTWGDFDKDGYMDVFVANGGTVSSQKKNFLYRNNGDETFTKISTGLLVNQNGAFTTCSWIDVDNDTDLDLFVGRSFGANQLFKNEGNGNFSQEVLNDNGGTWGISWSDYDKDGDLDGFGTNWAAPNYFYKNENGNLTRIAFPPLTTGSSNSLSPNWGDYNNDGWTDLFVGNSAARDRLFQNNRNGSFSEITDSPITAEVINSEGSCWADWDNDGDLDLLLASGGNQSTGFVRMYENGGDGQFLQIDDGELTTLIGRYEGLTCVDFDKDGDLDVFISNYFNNDNLLYFNNGNSNSWVNIELIGITSNTNGIGSKIYVKANIGGEEIWQLREIIAHSAHVTQSSLRAHFGLGDASIIDSIKVIWPTQEEQILKNIATHQYLKITEGEEVLATKKPLKIKQLLQFRAVPNPFAERLNISFQLPKNEWVNLEILDIKGQNVGSIFKGQLAKGRHQFKKNASNLASGFYMLRLVIAEGQVLEKVLLIK